MNTDNIVIDRVTDVVLKCRDNTGNCLNVIYEVDDANVFVTLESLMPHSGSEINIRTRIKSCTTARDEAETEDLSEESSEELDKFLEQYNKCAIMPLHN